MLYNRVRIWGNWWYFAHTTNICKFSVFTGSLAVWWIKSGEPSFLSIFPIQIFKRHQRTPNIIIEYRNSGRELWDLLYFPKSLYYCKLIGCFDTWEIFRFRILNWTFLSQIANAYLKTVFIQICRLERIVRIIHVHGGFQPHN